MAFNLEDIIARQDECFGNIKKLCVNYKKDGSERKTKSYLTTRLTALDSHWGEFESNDEKLMKQENKSHPYYVNQVYEKTKILVEDVRNDILVRLERLTLEAIPETQESLKSNFDFEEINNTINETPAAVKIQELNGEKIQELLKQQQCSFKAFERAAEKINLDLMTEKWELEDHLNILKAKWDIVDKTHWKIDYILQGSNPQYQNQYLTWETRYDNLKKEINKKIWNSAHYAKTTPRIELPDFHGSYTQWISFKDLFTESVHTNPLLSKTQKMQLLKSKLKGEAEKLIQHLAISAENYDSCWEILQHRYNNERLLFTSFMNTLLNQQSIQQPNAFNIRKIHDVTLECLNGFTNLGLDITTWDPVIVHLISQKLDSITYGEYIRDLESPRDLPNLEDFIKFLETKFMAYETMQRNQNQKQVPCAKPSFNHYPTNKYNNKPSFSGQSRFNNYYKGQNAYRSTHYNKQEISPKTYCMTAKTCPLCKTTSHVLMQCDTFLSMSCDTRNDTVSKLQLCKNCLYSHGNKQCFSRKTCKECQKSHHTLLHRNEIPTTSNNGERVKTTSTQGNRAVNNITNNGKEVLLATIKLQAKCIDGTYITLRALLDQGSQMNLISEDAAQRLRLPRQRFNAGFKSVGSINGKCKGVINLEFKSLHSDEEFKIQPFIINKLINNLPNTSFSNTQGWNYLKNLKLADPDFNISGPIDMLLGADTYSELILDGLIKGDNDYPIAQQTKMGWVLCGNVKTFNCYVTLIDLEQLTRFWESEEISESSTLTSEEEYCENHYKQTTERLSDGKYVVKMPMKPDYEKNICNTRPQAISQFYQLEKKMGNNSAFATEYRKFMNDYIAMGHMIPRKKINEKQVYLPHHGVLKTESTTTKLRAVFNASYKTKNSNHCLNDLMYTGPNLQKDMCSLLLNWRLYKYVFTADVEKMYRNINLNEEQQHLQTIIWRDTPHEPLKEWQLTTVTYGTKAAPYLAMRTLHQLAEDEGHAFPIAANVLRNYFYMDDLVHGQDSIKDAKKLIHQLIELMKKGGFNLRKWSSNEPAVLNELKEEQKCLQNTINFNQDGSSTSSTKTLGIRWNPREDTYLFNWQLPEIKRLTKRSLLSEISKLYDPMGWLSPTTIKAKLIFQKVWSTKLEWDEYLPNEIIEEWENLRRDLPNVNKISLRRWIHCNENHIEIHGFCDASDKAYACVIYSKTQNEIGEPVVTLLAAKTKVAPLKTKLTTPRMELCGAVLLSKLVKKLQDTFSNKQLYIYCWTDSQVVLAWLQGEVTKWQSYVASRVTLINKTLPGVQWRYVKSEENPADCASRGLSPSQLLNFKLWWEGPQFIQTKNEEKLSQKDINFVTENEIKITCLALQSDTPTVTRHVISNLLHKYSALTRVIRVVTWLLRWTNRLRNKNKTMGDNLSLPEQEKAWKLIIKHVQEEIFGEDLQHLKRTGTVSKKSRLLTLSPFLDEDGLLRVRGRLNNSTLPTETKHPIILPSSGRLTELIVYEAHNKTLHGGARLTLANTRLQYWILGGNATVKKYLRRCVRCHRFKPHRNEQIMADLPAERVIPSKPFTNTGIDFTGHVDIKINKGRGVKTCKAYIAIFICMVTKAVHLELASDLSTQTFLAAFRRMCSRRGTPKNVFTDNGTNFVGAEKILRKDFEENKTLTSPELREEMSQQRINWKFNAPLWPTAGGLWEAAVKSMKYHLKRVLGEQKLTFEQFTTLLTEIEACLNSRPLSPLTEDPDDLDYLTPGHFLIGGPIISLPQKDDGSNKIDCINRWKLVEHMKLQIWKRWSNEYLHQLQTRSKWQKPGKNLEEGNLVLIKENNLPAGRWALGRVTELHPGTDGHVRVVTLKTKGGYLKRPITKLAPLPINDYDQISPSHSPALKHDPSATKQSIEKEENPPRRSNVTTKSRVKFNCFTILTMLFMTFTGTYCETTNYKITNLQQDQPIYFDETENLQLIHDEWTLLTYYNLTTYWRASRDIATYIDKIDRACKRMTHAPCDAIVRQLRHEVKHLTEFNKLLLSQHMTRRRRGYFDGVGSLMRSMFGVLDSQFAEKYERDIAALQTNDRHLLELIRNQTLIVEAENNIIKKSEATMKEQFQALQTYMIQVHAELSNIEYRVQRLFTMSDVNSLSLTASLILNNLHRIQSTLLEALADVYRGHLDMRIFPASFLSMQLNAISSKLPKGLSLPIKNIQQDINNIYKLTFVKARITENFMLFEIHIPLLTEDQFTLYRVIPIPFITDEKLRLIKGTSDYIGINFAKDTFITTNEDYLRNCISAYEDGFICFNNQPIYHLQDKDAPCEAKIFSQHTSLTCVTDDVTCKDEWRQLHKVNKWLYTTCNNYLQRIVCGDQVTSVSLRGTGIIIMKPRCLLKTKDATIFSFNEFGSKSYYEADIEEINLNSTNSINNMIVKNWRNANLSFINSNYSAISNDLAKIQEKLAFQKEHEVLPNPDFNNHDIYHYTMSSLLCIGALVLVVYFVLKKCRKPKKKNTVILSQPEPAELRGIELREIKRHRTTSAPEKKRFDLSFD